VLSWVSASGSGGSAPSNSRASSRAETARARGLQTIALTGRDGGAVGRAASIHINVPSDATARVQEVHRTVLHIICDIVERAFE